MNREIKLNLPRAPFPKRVSKKLRRLWQEHQLNRRKADYRRSQPSASLRTVAFIVGCQRSGTSMTLSTLNESLDVDVYNESDARAFVDCRIKPAEVLDGIVNSSSARCVMFKPVCESHRVTELLGAHDHARAVWMYRDYQDVANSAVERWEDTTQRWLKDLLNGGGGWGLWQWNQEKVTRECLAEIRTAVQDEDITPHAAAVLFWYLRNRTYFEQALADRSDVLLVKYEELVTTARPEFERICAFLGIRFSPDMIRNVSTTSLRKKPFPAIPERVHELCRGMLARLDAVRHPEGIPAAAGTR